jgi:hypothetical protein
MPINPLKQSLSIELKFVLINLDFEAIILTRTEYTLPTVDILSGKNVRAWVSMVLYSKNK